MSDRSPIEWTDATWNPVTGCTEVSPGCDHCYARTFAERWRGVPGHHFEQGFDLKLWPDRLDYPLAWKKPRRIFVNSMSDLFHKDIPDDFILRVFEVMAKAKWHTFQVLTKRPSRMARLSSKISERIHSIEPVNESWPANIWVGTSIETMRYDWRVAELRNVPARVHFISAEPLLGSLEDLDISHLEWVIVGGESGPGFRKCETEWVRELRDKCQAHDIAFFFKQWGGISHRAGGRHLDGRTWDEFPRTQFPASLSCK
jgi:protein gp37